MMLFPRPWIFFVVLLWNVPASGQTTELDFRQSIRPFLKTYCFSCHDADDPAGDLDLTADEDLPAVLSNFRHWMVVLERLEAADMPPNDADAQPTPRERKTIIDWIKQVRDAEADRTSGDPGIVLARRLSNAEYDYTIGDLIGVEIRPAHAFPVDPANEAGFDNSGESLTMSPALLKKYLSAARTVSQHMALTPSGIVFSPHPIITATDRDKFCVNRIIDFYRRQNTNLEDYFLLIWEHTTAADTRSVRTLEDRARTSGLSPKYTETLAELLSAPPEPLGPIAALQTLWSELPQKEMVASNAAASHAKARDLTREMASFVVRLRKSMVPEVPNLTAPGMNNGSQSLVLWKNRQFVTNRRRFAGIFPNGKFGLPDDSPAAKTMQIEGREEDPQLLSALNQFCSIFPDAFLVSERARVYLDPKKEQRLKGRYLSAGFHSQMGYFRDDAPLYDMMLNESQQKEIDRLWLELDFITSAPMRQYAGFIWFDRTDSGFMRDREFDRYRAEDKDCTSEQKVRGLETAYIRKATSLGASTAAIEALHHYFNDMSATFRRLEKLRIESEAEHITGLVQFAQRAFRRPLSDAQQLEIIAFYRHLRDVDGLNHEDAIRDGVVRTLMSPHFCYRIDLPRRFDDQVENSSTPDIEPLNAYALASRLSYFLWSSMPDEELLSLAEQGRLLEREVLVKQTGRMLRDNRSRGFVTEFAGNWLEFRRFKQHNGVALERFPEFTDGLRAAMYEEPIRFLRDLIVRDGSILDCLYADHTFVDQELAEHYGAPFPTEEIDENPWKRLESAGQYGRGGLLPMAAFLTYNSPGLRTSPVKRGNWVVKRILGENVPAPPATVPELPEDETQLGELTLREALQRHRADASCATCHERIDAFGLTLEGYGPVGELRTEDLGGRTVDDSAVFPDQSRGHGLAGLQKYIRQQRQDDFVENLCRKLLAYALGRTLQLSDESTINEMINALEINNYRFSSMIEPIVTSPAFLNRRVRLEH